MIQASITIAINDLIPFLEEVSQAYSEGTFEGEEFWYYHKKFAEVEKLKATCSVLHNNELKVIEVDAHFYAESLNMVKNSKKEKFLDALAEEDNDS